MLVSAFVRMPTSHSIPHEIDLWGADVNRDWPWRRKRLPPYLETNFDSMRIFAACLTVAGLAFAATPLRSAPPPSTKDYAAQANESAQEQTTQAGSTRATKDVPTEMYERAKKLYPEEFWKDPEPDQKITPIKLLKAVPPTYPLAYRVVATEGEVWVAFVVDAEGRVIDAKPLTEFASQFIEAAIEAVKKWKFEPATRDGKAVPTLVIVPIQFWLEKR